jgi:RNA polymerase sigma-70 factor (ECF subfamily)
MIADAHDIYERYARDVHRFVLYLSGDPALADDITAESFVRLWTAPGEIRTATVKSYLFTIARNLYLSGQRHRRRETDVDVVSLPTAAPSPERLTIARDQARHVFAALGRLPEIDRTALMLHAREQMPYQEIASILGLSVTAVKVKVHRARVRLLAWSQSMEPQS